MKRNLILATLGALVLASGLAAPASAHGDDDRYERRNQYDRRGRSDSSDRRHSREHRKLEDKHDRAHDRGLGSRRDHDRLHRKASDKHDATHHRAYGEHAPERQSRYSDRSNRRDDGYSRSNRYRR